MKILLVGEYSRLHNSLKEGLLKLGHQVVLIGMEDGFKKYPTDLLIRKKVHFGLSKLSGEGRRYQQKIRWQASNDICEQ